MLLDFINPTDPFHRVTEVLSSFQRKREDRGDRNLSVVQHCQKITQKLNQLLQQDLNSEFR